MDAINLFASISPWVIYGSFLLSLGVLIYIIVLYVLQKKFRSKELKIIKDLEERNKAFAATSALNSIILQILDFDRVAQLTADAIPQFLGYQTGVLAVVDEKKGVLRRVAISQTPGGKAALESLEAPFTSIEIKLSEDQNYCIRALKENKILSTTYLYDVLRPVISEENAQRVQRMMGTRTTLVYPIYSMDRKPIGTFLVSMNKSEDKISLYEHQTIRNFIDGARIALVNSIIYTSLRKTTQQLGEANRKLQELDRLKDEFVSLASHELRTPMTVIKSYLWMVLAGRGGALSEKQKFYLARAAASVDRLLKLVNEMLDVSRIESGRLMLDLQSLALDKLAYEVVDELTSSAQGLGIEIGVHPSPRLPSVVADRDKIKQVFINLIGNSFKFTPRGGKIDVNIDEKDGMVETRISDTGRGIAQENLPRLFQKFGLLGANYRVISYSGQGTGLGLYITKSIIELHRGNIWAFSEGEGKGSTFAFTLPKVG